MMSKVKQLIDGNRAVSPVIGVILMVAVTVLLGAVVAGFTTGLGDDLNQNAPDAQIEFDYDNANSDLIITHDGGDTFNADNTQELRVAGPNAGDMTFNKGTPSTQQGGEVVASGSQLGATVQAGDTIAVTHADGSASPFPSDGEVRLVWVGPAGDSSATIGQYEGPAA